MPHRQKNQKEVERDYRNIFEATGDGLIVYRPESGLVLEANPAACIMHGYPRQEFIGLDLTKIIHPDSHEALRECMQTDPSDGIFETQLQHIRRDGEIFPAEWRGTFFSFQGRPCILGIVRDVSKRIQDEKLLQRQIETRTHEQETLLAISHTLASTLELQPGLILDQLREIIEYTHGGLFALEDSSLVALAMRGPLQLELSSPFRIHLQGPEIMTALFNGYHPVRVPNLWNNSSEARFLRSLLADGASVLLQGMQSWMWVPLAVKNRILGCVGVAHEEEDYFTAHHADLALSVANQAAITMVNAELYGHARTVAVLEERQRLARNLHDAVNQSLFSAGLIAEVLPRLWDRDQDLARQSLEDLCRLTRGAQAEMRALLAELRPSTLTDSNLDDLLRLLGNALSGRINIPVIVNATEEFTLPTDVQVAFYRVCQEALNNIAKHAKASKVEINLTKEGNEIEMYIRDDGQGFDPEETFSGHYGLGMMRERTEAIQAQLSISSRPGEGTELTVCWTIPTPMEDL